MVNTILLGQERLLFSLTVFLAGQGSFSALFAVSWMVEVGWFDVVMR